MVVSAGSACILSVPVPFCFIRLCIPIRATNPPIGEASLDEPKLDGYRVQIAKERQATPAATLAHNPLADRRSSMPSYVYSPATASRASQACRQRSGPAGGTSSWCTPSISCTAAAPICECFH